ncbi:MAG: EAL domain-containing protein [Comamonadaceae bacterium]|nr:MAG: EAL domain-containing protein [Comamonadaceae bacterium]
MADMTFGPRERRVRTIYAVAAVLMVVGSLIPIALAGYAALQSAEETQMLRLELASAKVAERAALALAQARTTLVELESNDDEPCSQEHVTAMRRFTLDTLSVEEISYLGDGRERCTTWLAGAGTARDRDREPDFVLDDDIKAFSDSHSHIPGSAPMLGLRKGHYQVLINLNRFTDVNTEPDIHVALQRTSGPVLATSAGVTRESMQELLLPGGLDGDHLMHTEFFGGWTAIAVGGTASKEEIWHLGLLLLPAGLLSAGIVIFLVLRVSRKRLSPLMELRQGIRNREFVVQYQPIVELASGRCVGAEALVRWKRPEGDMVRPDLFIPLAEEHGIISEISEQVMQQVVRDMDGLLSLHPDIHVAVNLAAQDVATTAALQRILSLIPLGRIDPAQIWLEVTERGCVQGGEGAIALQDARTAGHQVAIDDFGTGYCGLQYLQTLPVSILKIDRSFVQTIATDSVSSVVLPHIIDLAQAMHLQMVAEGVETQEQADYLVSRGVQFAQGWLFARPMSVEDFAAYLESQAS